MASQLNSTSVVSKAVADKHSKVSSSSSSDASPPSRASTEDVVMETAPSETEGNDETVDELMKDSSFNEDKLPVFSKRPLPPSPSRIPRVGVPSRKSESVPQAMSSVREVSRSASKKANKPNAWANQLEIASLKAQVKTLIELQRQTLSRLPAADATSSTVSKILLEDAQKSVFDYNGEHDPVLIESLLSNMAVYAEKAKFSDDDQCIRKSSEGSRSKLMEFL